ncbi:MAG: response regulator, partial [Thiovulaceae bacterium]|nr:response regulator [Sulfurimonadaceae bacterium]
NYVDIVLLDVNLSGNLEGIDLAKFINANYNTSIIFITAYTDSIVLNAISETNYSAYIVKPFKREELEVSLKLQEYKTKRLEHDLVDLAYSYKFDVVKGELFLHNDRIHITKQEQVLLQLLSERLGVVVPFSLLNEKVWEGKEVSENTRRNLIYKTNKKFPGKMIKSQSGLGYYLEKV